MSERNVPPLSSPSGSLQHHRPDYGARPPMPDAARLFPSERGHSAMAAIPSGLAGGLA